MPFTVEQRILILEEWLKEKDSHKVQNKFKQIFPNAAVPSRQAMYELAKKFHETGTVHDVKKSGRPLSACSIDNQENVRVFYGAHPATSKRRASIELNLSRRSLSRIMKDLKLRMWRPRLLHSLNEDDFDRRTQFAEWYLAATQNDATVIDRIIWTDEATFHLHGAVNRHNCVYYSVDNPHLIDDSKKVQSQGVCVWGGILSTFLIGPYLFDDTVNGQNYLNMLVNFVMPRIDPDANNIWMQDGAPPHFSREVRNFLDETFQTWIGRRGTIDWPPRSPDMTPCDFALWGILKERVYRRRPQTMANLRDYIIQEFNDLNADKNLLSDICHTVTKRCDLCIQENGRHFENHL